MRQTGNTNEDFRKQLERLATGKFSIQDWKSWKSQDLGTMKEMNKQSFINEGTMLCAKKADMTRFNTYHLKNTGHPITKLKAENSKGASSFDSDSAQGLRNSLFLSKGAK